MTFFFKNENTRYIIMAVSILVIILVIFWPREGKLARAGIYAYLGNIGGKFDIEAFESNSPTLALFFAPWCPHCKNMMPEWDMLEKNNDTDVKIVKVNCDEQPDLAKKFGVESFPIIYFLPEGLNNPANLIEYKGDRKGEAFLSFIKSNTQN